MKWLKRLFSKQEGPSDDDHEQWWNARLAALESILGPSEDVVHHAPHPLYLGGFADVVEFRNYVPGHAYVTCDLVGSSGQPKCDLGNYELMVCTRERSDWAPGIISRLAKYTLETPLQPGETMDVGPAAPEGSTTAALLFAEPDVESNRLEVRGLRAGLLLCVGITAQELDVCRQRGPEIVLSKLKDQGIFPYTDLQRESVR